MTGVDSFKFPGWAVITSQENGTLAGYVRQVEVWGTMLIALDIPDDSPQGRTFSHFYYRQDVDTILPITEQRSRELVHSQPPPVNYDFKPQIISKPHQEGAAT